MIRYRALATPRELCCCLPTPYCIPRRIAGLAFNFSLVDVARLGRHIVGPKDRKPISIPAEAVHRRSAVAR